MTMLRFAFLPLTGLLFLGQVACIADPADRGDRDLTREAEATPPGGESCEGEYNQCMDAFDDEERCGQFLEDCELPPPGGESCQGEYNQCMDAFDDEER